MYNGTWPAADHNGNDFSPLSAEGQLAGGELADGFFGVIWGLKGDLKFFHECLGMQCVTAGSPCDWCPCHRNEGGDPLFAQFNFAKDGISGSHSGGLCCYQA